MHDGAQMGAGDTASRDPYITNVTRGTYVAVLPSSIGSPWRIVTRQPPYIMDRVRFWAQILGRWTVWSNLDRITNLVFQ